MTNEDLLKIQSVQYDMLKEIVKICEANNIQYYLFYGTLLGAVRHHGTIPWDYDIDICMTRENHDRFLQLTQYMNEEYAIYHVGSGEVEYTGLTRVYKKGTKIYTKKHGLEGAHPIHVDIFIMDTARAFSKICEKFVTCLAMYLSLAKLSAYEKEWLYERFETNSIKKIIIKSGDIVRKICGEANIEKWMYNLLVEKEKSNSRNYLTLVNIKRRYSIDWFGEGTPMQYEKSKLNVPFKYDSVLTYCYGDYMELPPEEQRFTKDMEKWLVIF